MQTGRLQEAFMKNIYSVLIVGVTACLLMPQIAVAYVGPGAGLTAIGTVLALIGAILLGIFGFIWYPVKRLLRGRKSSDDEEIDGTVDDAAAIKKNLESATDDQ